MIWFWYRHPWGLKKRWLPLRYCFQHLVFPRAIVLVSLITGMKKRLLPLREYTNLSAESGNLGRLMIIRYGFTFLNMLLPEALDA
jgi:hypothetical protein